MENSINKLIREFYLGDDAAWGKVVNTLSNRMQMKLDKRFSNLAEGRRETCLAEFEVEFFNDVRKARITADEKLKSELHNLSANEAENLKLQICAAQTKFDLLRGTRFDAWMWKCLCRRALDALRRIENRSDYVDFEDENEKFLVSLPEQNQISDENIIKELLKAGLKGDEIIYLEVWFRENPEPTNTKPETIKSPETLVNIDSANSTQKANGEAKKEISAPKKPKKENPSKKITPEINLAQLSVGEREAVRESLRTGNISLAGSDLALLQNLPVRRGNSVIKTVKPISPTNEATLETQPDFRWKNAENAEYQIIVTDRSGREVAKSEILQQNTWQTSKALSAGFYFWQITFRQKGETEFLKNRGQTMFKILNDAEKRQLETGIDSTESNLVRAILYARAGLLSEAESELYKKPISAKARKMLTQIKTWQEK